MTIEEMGQRLERIEDTLQQLLTARIEQEYYSTKDVAEILSKAEFTVREWCRHGRVYAEKRPSGQGRSKEWMISNAELQRIRSEGLLSN